MAHNPAVHECMKLRLLNYHALAASIRKDVEREVGRETSVNTIVVALTRLAKSMERERRVKPLSVLRGARIRLASDVVDVVIKTGKSEQLQIVRKIAELSPRLSEPISLFQLSNSIKLVADEREYNSLIRQSLDRMLIARETSMLSRLDIHLMTDIEASPEFGLFLTELLYRYGIRLRHTYIGEETILILGRDDGPRAYEVLKAEIDRSRKEPP